MKQFLTLIIAIAVFSSCRKVIDVDLNEANPAMVIEANYTADDSTVVVRVTTTSNYFDNEPEPTIDDALITITDGLGGVQTIPFSADGEYILTNYIPQFNSTYTISVSHAGDIYTASAYLNTVVTQEPIFYEFLDQGFFGGEGGYLAYVSYNDPAAEENYYFVEYKRNDTLIGSFQTDDLFTNGNLVEQPLFEEFYDVGDLVDIELRSIDEKIYLYANEIDGATDTGSAAPANPTFQWTNRALGYFSAHGSSKQQIVIQ